MCEHKIIIFVINQNHLPWNQEISAHCDECGRFFDLNRETAPEGAVVCDEYGNRCIEFEGE